LNFEKGISSLKQLCAKSLCHTGTKRFTVFPESQAMIDTRLLSQISSLPYDLKKEVFNF